MSDSADPIEEWQRRLDVEGSVMFAPARWRFVAFFAFVLCIVALSVAGIVAAVRTSPRSRSLPCPA